MTICGIKESAPGKTALMFPTIKSVYLKNESVRRFMMTVPIRYIFPPRASLDIRRRSEIVYRDRKEHA